MLLETDFCYRRIRWSGSPLYIKERIDEDGNTAKRAFLPVSLECNSNHFLEKTVDEFFSVAEVAALREVVRLLSPSAARIVQLEVPKEIVSHFEVGSNGEDFVNEILHADDSELAQSLLNDFVGEGASSSLQLSVSALVDEFADGLEVGIAPGDVRIRDSQHTQRRLVQLNKGGVVDLTESKQLQNLSDSGVKAVDTPYPHDDRELRFRRDVEVAVFASVAR